MGNSDFSKPLALSDQRNILPFAIISAVMSHPGLRVTKLGLPPRGWQWFCASPPASCLYPGPCAAVVGSGEPSVGISNASASICWVRADTLAGRGAVASGKPLLINQIRHVMALITINILDRDDEDAVQSLSDSKNTHTFQHSHTQFLGCPCSSPDPPGLMTASNCLFASASRILPLSSPLSASGLTLPVCLPPSSLCPACIPCFSLKMQFGELL